MWHMHDVGWGWWSVMSVGMVAFWALVIYGIVWLARGASSTTQPKSEPPGPAEAPLVVLKRRVAAGEIRLEEYEALRAAIEETPSPAAAEPSATATGSSAP